MAGAFWLVPAASVWCCQPLSGCVVLLRAGPLVKLSSAITSHPVSLSVALLSAATTIIWPVTIGRSKLVFIGVNEYWFIAHSLIQCYYKLVNTFCQTTDSCVCLLPWDLPMQLCSR